MACACTNSQTLCLHNRRRARSARVKCPRDRTRAGLSPRATASAIGPSGDARIKLSKPWPNVSAPAADDKPGPMYLHALAVHGSAPPERPATRAAVRKRKTTRFTIDPLLDHNEAYWYCQSIVQHLRPNVFESTRFVELNTSLHLEKFVRTGSTRSYRLYCFSVAQTSPWQASSMGCCLFTPASTATRSQSADPVQQLTHDVWRDPRSTIYESGMPCCSRRC